MRLREIPYQMSLKLKSLLPVFHKAHDENLIWMVVGMVCSRSVWLPPVAEQAPVSPIQVESRVQRLERLRRCAKLDPLQVLKPVATRVLKSLSRLGPLMILMDRTMINDRLNLLSVAVSFGGRALPLGWVVVPHEGNSNLALPPQLLGWVHQCLPAGAEVSLVADREFHSIHLARRICTQMKVHFVLRITAGTWVQVNGRWGKAGSLAIRGRSWFWSSVVVTRDRRVADFGVNLLVWSPGEDEPWLVISSAHDPARIEAIYRQRFWIEEMFSDQKSRGLNLEATRLTDPDRLHRLLVAVTLAYLWIMEGGRWGWRAAGGGRWTIVARSARSVSVRLAFAGCATDCIKPWRLRSLPVMLSPWRNKKRPPVKGCCKTGRQRSAPEGVADRSPGRQPWERHPPQPQARWPSG